MIANSYHAEPREKQEKEKEYAFFLTIRKEMFNFAPIVTKEKEANITT